MDTITVNRKLQIELNPLYNHIALILLCVGVVLFVIFMIFLIRYRVKHWLFVNFPNYMIWGIAMLLVVVIIANGLSQIKDYKIIREHFAYTGEVVRVTDDAVELKEKDGKKIFVSDSKNNHFDETLNKGDIAVIKAIENYDSYNEVSSRGMFSADNLYYDMTVEKKD